MQRLSGMEKHRRRSRGIQRRYKLRADVGTFADSGEHQPTWSCADGFYKGGKLRIEARN